MMSMMLPAIRGVQEERKAKAAEKRAAEALLDGQAPDVPQQDEAAGEEETRIEVDASFTISEKERLKTLDFEQMSTAEIAGCQSDAGPPYAASGTFEITPDGSQYAGQTL